MGNLSEMHTLLTANGWPPVTAVCTMLFSLMHWPCFATEDTRKQRSIPAAVGMRKDAAVHLRLAVSLCIVMQVVEQGQCIRENSMVHTAVTGVQPFAVSRVCISDRLPISVSVPPAI